MSTIQTALVAAAAAAFSADAHAVAPRLDRSERVALGVRVDEAGRLGSLSRARAELSVVCPAHEETLFGETLRRVAGWRPREVLSGGVAWRIIRWELRSVDQARTTDAHLFARVVFDIVHGETQ